MDFLKKTNNLLLFIILILTVLYLGASFLIPFAFAIFLAMLMTPFSNLMEKVKINRVISSFLSTCVIFIAIGGVFFLISFQMDGLMNDLPAIREKMNSIIQATQNQITSLTGVSLEEQKSMMENRSDEILKTIEFHLTRFLGGTVGVLGNFLLILVYLFLLLLYRKKFPKFIMMFVEEENRRNTKFIVREISKVSYQYLLGRVKVMSILAILYYITFLIFGLPFAILLTVFGALVTVIPYIGPLISGVLPILFAVFYLDSTYTIILFTAIVLIVQLIESYILEPVIIGNEVKLNPLIEIIAVILGGFFWGISGMILFVPIFAAMNIIFSHNSKLKPLGYLFGHSK
ncbi:AI-2E family transporter [Marivirga sp. S37H4]|uniref:AI-2E family transporter n=1 Tax=Marivirga aurantiaca TaxID=2802615 RepID=A0A935CBV4_9BACT|nr:AI-2E family transporter [Marivirga aurantiaca]MBK6265588.1 AI-2E family transporter [Marivirga aurantiaca]